VKFTASIRFAQAGFCIAFPLSPSGAQPRQQPRQGFIVEGVPQLVRVERTTRPAFVSRDGAVIGYAGLARGTNVAWPIKPESLQPVTFSDSPRCQKRIEVH